MKNGPILLASVLLAMIMLCNAAEPAMKDTASNVSQKNIVETAIAAGDFNTLVTAVKTAGLVETLSGPGPFTVFAPTDEAFAKIPKADLAAILANKTMLTAVLAYHVIPGKVMSTDLKNGMKAKTVEGADLLFKVEPTGVMVDNANVTKADIVASNGVIHVIDAVLLPPAETAAEKVTKIEQKAEAAKTEIGQKAEAAKTEIGQKAEAAKTEVEQKAEAAKTGVEQKAEAAKPAQSTPGFEGILAVTGLLAIAFILRKRI